MILILLLVYSPLILMVKVLLLILLLSFYILPQLEQMIHIYLQILLIINMILFFVKL